MSVHMMIAAAYLEELNPSAKLVLMAFADSGDEQTLESAPGFAKLRAWSGLKRSQTTATVAQLVAGRYVELVEGGRLGRRAVYRVFPDGVPAIPHPREVTARYSTDSSPPVENPAEEGPTHRPLGADPAATRGRPTGPLQSFTSVSSARTVSEPVETRRPPAAGFPGSRATAEEDRAVARRARGAHNRPCPMHPDEVVPCRRCAHVAANADPAVVAEARQQARAAVRAAHEEPTG